MNEELKIDVDSVLRSRLEKYYRLMPRFVVRWLEKIICQDDLNSLLMNNSDKSGVDFCDGVLSDLNVTYRVSGSLPADHRKVIIVSNHPLGGLDGMVLSSMVSRQYNSLKDIKFVVNDLLNYITPLKPIFYGVNKHGSQSREAAAGLDEAFASDRPVIMFPAGLCSRKNSDGIIADLTWHKMAIAKALSYKRDIIPIQFGGENSHFFYKFAQLRSRLGLKFNLEMILLPREVFKNRGKQFDIRIGDPIPWQTLRGGRHAQSEIDRLRNIVYDLAR